MSLLSALSFASSPIERGSNMSETCLTFRSFCKFEMYVMRRK
jgi:hypothetical protein